MREVHQHSCIALLKIVFYHKDPHSFSVQQVNLRNQKNTRKKIQVSPRGIAKKCYQDNNYYCIFKIKHKLPVN
jgi:hypothetical protein